MALSCLIIDDEPIAQNILQRYVEDTPTLTLLKVCDNALQAMSFLQENSVDLIFLDIEMPKINGLAFLRTLESPPATIFTTAYREFALDSYELNAADYLLKPFSYERFLKAVNKVSSQSYSSPNPSFAYFKVDRKHVKIYYDEIRYIEGLSNYVIIHTVDQQYVVYHRLKDLEDQLGKKQFVRIHKSFIISLKQMTAYGSDYVELGEKQLTISNTYREAFFRAVEHKNH